MDVGSTTGVVSREDRLELDNALAVAGLDSAQEGCVQVCGVVGVAVSAGLDAGVHTLHRLVFFWVWVWDGLIRTVALQCQMSM